jgi:hypothetical protein
VIRKSSPKVENARVARTQGIAADEGVSGKVQAKYGEDEAQYIIIGECYIDGLDNGLFGHLPAGWKLEFDKIKTGYGATHTYIHTASGTKLRGHPSLEPLSLEWKPFERERRPEDPSTFICFRNDITGEERNSDPLLTSERLIRRGIAMTDFVFV